jgi:hypothetical protein
MWESMWNQAVGGSWENFDKHDRETLNCHEQIVDRNMDSKGVAGESSEGSEGHVNGNWRKGNS